MLSNLLSLLILSISSLIILINPLGVLLMYVLLSEGMERDAKRQVAREACRIAFVILLVFTVCGTWILQVFGISIDAFRIAGGILLFGIGMEMVYAKQSRTKVTATEKYESIDASDIAVMPLAIPMIAGPGSITTVVVLANEALHYHVLSVIVVIISIVLIILLTYILLLNADKIVEKVGQREYRVINRLMGILLIAIAVQFVITGLISVFPILAGGV